MSNEGDRAAVFRTTKVRTKLKGDASWLQRRSEPQPEAEEEKPWVAEVRASRLNGAPTETSPVSSPTKTTPPPTKPDPERAPTSGFLIRGIFTKLDKPASSSTSNGFSGTTQLNKKPSESYKKIAVHTLRSASEDQEGQLSPEEQEKRTEAASNVLKKSAVRQRSYVFSAAKKYESKEKAPDTSLVNSSSSFVAKRVEITDDDESTATPAPASSPPPSPVVPVTSVASAPVPKPRKIADTSVKTTADEPVAPKAEEAAPEPAKEEPAPVSVTEKDPFEGVKPGCTKVATPLPELVPACVQAACTEPEPQDSTPLVKLTPAFPTALSTSPASPAPAPTVQKSPAPVSPAPAPTVPESPAPASPAPAPAVKESPATVSPTPAPTVQKSPATVSPAPAPTVPESPVPASCTPAPTVQKSPALVSPAPAPAVQKSPAPVSPAPAPTVPESLAPASPAPAPTVQESPATLSPTPAPTVQKSPATVSPAPDPTVPESPASVSPAPAPTVQKSPAPVSPAPTPTVQKSPAPVSPAPDPTVPESPAPVSPAPAPTVQESPAPVSPAPTPTVQESPAPVSPAPTPTVQESPTPVSPAPAPTVPESPAPVSVVTSITVKTEPEPEPEPESKVSPKPSSRVDTFTALFDSLIPFDTSSTSSKDDEPELAKEEGGSADSRTAESGVEEEPAPALSHCEPITEDLLALNDGPEESAEPVPPSPGRWSQDLLSGLDSEAEPAKTSGTLDLLANDVVLINTEARSLSTQREEEKQTAKDTQSPTETVTVTTKTVIITDKSGEDNADPWSSLVTTTVTESSSADPFDPYPIGTTSPNSSSDLLQPFADISINSASVTSTEDKEPSPEINPSTQRSWARTWETSTPQQTATEESQEPEPEGQAEDQQTLIMFERKSTESNSPWDRWTSPTVYTITTTTGEEEEEEEEEESPEDTETQTVTAVTTIREIHSEPEPAMDRYETYSRTVMEEEDRRVQTPEPETKKGFVYVKEYVNATELSLHNARDTADSGSDYLTSKSVSYSQSSPRYSSGSLSSTCTYCGEQVGNDAKITIEHLNINCHPGCFKCGVCSKPMGDLLYSMFLHGGKVHCESCYSKALD